jgi:transcriptional regulator with XRE-family HTH domain
MLNLRAPIMDAMASDGLGYRIEQRRAALGLTQRDIAKRLGLTGASVSLWESGATKSIKLEHFFALADVLRCSPRWLATGDGTPDPEFGTPEDRALYNLMRSLDDDQRKALLALLTR